MMQMKFLERNYFPFQIVQLRWTRRTKCIQYNLTYNYNSILLIIAFIYEISFRIIKYCFT